MAIELRDVYKTYKGKSEKRYPILQGLNFHIRDGAMAAILGKSGSGKSTLLRILGLLEVPDQGSYYLFGEDMQTRKRKWSLFRNQKIGFIMQNDTLLEKLSVFDNIAAPMYISHKSYKEIEKRVTELAEKFHIEALLEKKACQLSGGEKQRTAIARAMVQNPKLLLADEPTGALDEENTQIVLQTLQKINEHGVSIILVTHDREAASICKEVYYLQDGKLKLY